MIPVLSTGPFSEAHVGAPFGRTCHAYLFKFTQIMSAGNGVYAILAGKISCSPVFVFPADRVAQGLVTNRKIRLDVEICMQILFPSLRAIIYGERRTDPFGRISHRIGDAGFR